jgi:hypothetical protein
VERPDDLAQLPRAHALALQLHELGADDELIALCLEIDVEAIPPLLEIARAKLAHITEIDVRETKGAAATPERRTTTGRDGTVTPDPSSTTKEIPR